MALRRALPGTAVPWSPDFPRPACASRGRPALWPSKYGLLGPRKQQGEQLRPAFAVDDAVNQVGPEAALEGDHRFLLVGDVVAETLEREEEAGVGPVRVDQVARRARQRQAALGQLPPREQ